MTLFPGLAMRRSHVLLAGAVGVVAVAAIAGRSGGEPASKIEGAAIEQAEETSTFEALASTPAPSNAIPAPPVLTLAEQLDLDHLVLAGDHYEVPLKDGRKAILTLDPALQQLAEKLLDEA